MTTLAEEEPFVAVVVDRFRENTCAKCFAWAYPGVKEDVSLFQCVGCLSMFYCSKECQKKDWEDHQDECDGIASTGAIPTQNVRFIARFFKKWWTKPEFKAFNGSGFNDLSALALTEATKADLRDQSIITFEELKKFQKFFRKLDITKELFFMFYIKAARNSFGILDSSPDSFVRGIGLYMGLSAHKHSCRPDAFFICKGPKLVLRTTKEDCAYNGEMTICYPTLSLFRSTGMRRAYLKGHFGIHCNCEECRDKEADMKRISGRPECCPDGYFLLSDLLCSVCDKEVSKDRRSEVHLTNFAVHRIVLEAEKDNPQKIFSVLELNELFNLSKQFLSDNNTYLISIADMLFARTMKKNPALAMSFGNYVIRQKSDRPHTLHGALLKARFFCVLDNERRSFKDRKAALIQALEAVEVVYGEDHEFTKDLKNKQLEIELEEHIPT